MALKQQAMAVGLYLAIIMFCYGQKNVLNKETYEANKAELEAKKRDKKQNLQYGSFRHVPDKVQAKSGATF